MTPLQRAVTKERIDAFKRALADPERERRQREALMPERLIVAEREGMQSIIAELEQQLADDEAEQFIAAQFTADCPRRRVDIDELRRVLCRYSSPTVGRGMVHGGVPGIIIYDDAWPFIEAALARP